MHHPTDRITHTTTFVTPVVEHWLEREIAQWVHPMKDRSDDSSHHERTLLPWSYISLPVRLKIKAKVRVMVRFKGRMYLWLRQVLSITTVDVGGQTSFKHFWKCVCNFLFIKTTD